MSLKATHIIYCETVVDWNPIRVKRKLINRFASQIASRQALGKLEYTYRNAGARLEGDELQIVENKKIAKRWVIAPVEKEKELKFEE